MWLFRNLNQLILSINKDLKNHNYIYEIQSFNSDSNLLYFYINTDSEIPQHRCFDDETIKRA